MRKVLQDGLGHHSCSLWLCQSRKYRDNTDGRFVSRRESDTPDIIRTDATVLVVLLASSPNNCALRGTVVFPMRKAVIIEAQPPPQKQTTNSSGRNKSYMRASHLCRTLTSRRRSSFCVSPAVCGDTVRRNRDAGTEPEFVRRRKHVCTVHIWRGLFENSLLPVRRPTLAPTTRGQALH